MANTDTYQTILACERWRDAIGLSVKDMPFLSRDMERAIGTIKAMSDELKRVRLSNISLRENRRVPLRGVRHEGRGSLVSAAVPLPLKAQAVAEAAGDGAIDVYRYQVGTVRWLKSGSAYKGRGEFIGRYDPGCDWRRVMEDLQA